MRVKKIKFIKKYGLDIWGVFKYKGCFNRYRRKYGVSKFQVLRNKLWLKKLNFRRFLLDKYLKKNEMKKIKSRLHYIYIKHNKKKHSYIVSNEFFFKNIFYSEYRYNYILELIKNIQQKLKMVVFFMLRKLLKVFLFKKIGVIKNIRIFKKKIKIEVLSLIMLNVYEDINNIFKNIVFLYHKSNKKLGLCIWFIFWNKVFKFMIKNWILYKKTEIYIKKRKRRILRIVHRNKKYINRRYTFKALKYKVLDMYQGSTLMLYKRKYMVFFYKFTLLKYMKLFKFVLYNIYNKTISHYVDYNRFFYKIKHLLYFLKKKYGKKFNKKKIKFRRIRYYYKRKLLNIRSNVIKVRNVKDDKNKRNRKIRFRNWNKFLFYKFKYLIKLLFLKTKYIKDFRPYKIKSLAYFWFYNNYEKKRKIGYKKKVNYLRKRFGKQFNIKKVKSFKRIKEHKKIEKWKKKGIQIRKYNKRVSKIIRGVFRKRKLIRKKRSGRDKTFRLKSVIFNKYCFGFLWDFIRQKKILNIMKVYDKVNNIYCINKSAIFVKTKKYSLLLRYLWNKNLINKLYIRNYLFWMYCRRLLKKIRKSKLVRKNKRRYAPAILDVGRPVLPRVRYRRNKMRNASLFLNMFKNLTYFYGNLRKRNIKIIMKRIGKTNFSKKFLYYLESQLCMIVFRMNFVRTVFEGKYFIENGIFMVNKKIVCDKEYLVQPGDVIEIVDGYKYLILIRIRRYLLRRGFRLFYPKYLEVDYRLLMGVYLAYPKNSEVIYPFNVGVNDLNKYYYGRF